MFYCGTCKSQLLIPLEVELWGSSFHFDNGPSLYISLCEPIDTSTGKVLKGMSRRKVDAKKFYCVTCKKEVPTDNIIIACQCGDWHPLAECFVILDNNYPIALRGPCYKKPQNSTSLIDILEKGIKLSSAGDE